jgi:hypothetical protein
VNRVIKPGIYRTTGPSADGIDCHWERKVTTSERTTVLEQGTTKLAVTVEIKPGDTSFVSKGCADWKREDSGTGSLGSLGLGSLGGTKKPAPAQSSPATGSGSAG